MDVHTSDLNTHITLDGLIFLGYFPRFEWIYLVEHDVF